ncbi:hypothetical protein ACFX13_009997 [Malus domestica]
MFGFVDSNTPTFAVIHLPLSLPIPGAQMKLISDAKFGRKKALEPQQNGQSTDGAAKKLGNSFKWSLVCMTCYISLRMSSGNSSARVLCTVHWMRKPCKGIFKFICLLEIPVRGFYVLFQRMRRRSKARFNFDDGSSFLFSILLEYEGNLKWISTNQEWTQMIGAII